MNCLINLDADDLEEATAAFWTDDDRTTRCTVCHAPSQADTWLVIHRTSILEVRDPSRRSGKVVGKFLQRTDTIGWCSGASSRRNVPVLSC
jgi:hypothetical protein